MEKTSKTKSSFRKKYFFLIIILPFYSMAGNIFKEKLADLIEKHPSVIAAHGQLRSSQADVQSALWSYYPTPSIGYERATDDATNILNKNTRYFRLQQPLWTAGRLEAQSDKAFAQLEVARFSLLEQRINIALKWIQLWAELQSANSKILAYQEAEKKHFQYYRQIERRSVEGYSAISDVDLSHSRLNSVRSDLRQQEIFQRQAKVKIEQLMGGYLDNENDLQQHAAWGVVVDYFHRLNWQMYQDSTYFSEIINSHPVIQKSLAQILVAQADLAQMQSRNFPEIYIRGEIRAGDVTRTEKVVFVGFNSNFGPGLSNLSATASAQAKVDIARSDVETRKLEISEVIQIELQNHQSQVKRLHELRNTFESNSKYLQASERQFLAGRRTWQDVMNTAREEAQIRVQLADSTAQIWLSQQRLSILTEGLDVYLSAPLSSHISP
jgi:outer membrane protein, adhesin transport system